MSDETTKPKEQSPDNPTTPPPSPLWSAICPNDLGLKAGYWSRNEQEPVTFRPISGWVTVTNFAAIPKSNPFFAVVLDDVSFPVMAPSLPNYIGVFGKSLTPIEARQKYAQWEPMPAKGDAGPAGGGNSGSQSQPPN